MKRMLLIICLALAVISVLGVWNCKSQSPLEEESQEIGGTVYLWENGTEQFVASENSPMSSFLFQTLRRLNLQTRCLLTEERIRDIKEHDKVIEMRFRFTEDITIGQWIESRDRDYIKTDENGYRILENVKYTLFILEDNLGGALEAHILVGSGAEFWSCWAIGKDGEIDKTWIVNLENLLLEKSD